MLLDGKQQQVAIQQFSQQLLKQAISFIINCVGREPEIEQRMIWCVRLRTIILVERIASLQFGDQALVGRRNLKSAILFVYDGLQLLQ